MKLESRNRFRHPTKLSVVPFVQFVPVVGRGRSQAVTERGTLDDDRSEAKNASAKYFEASLRDTASSDPRASPHAIGPVGLSVTPISVPDVGVYSNHSPIRTPLAPDWTTGNGPKCEYCNPCTEMVCCVEVVSTAVIVCVS